jgi:hypothetical protein
MKNKKAFKIAIIITIGSVAIIGAIAILTNQSMFQDSVSIRETVSEDSNEIIEINEEAAVPVEDEFPLTMSEYAVQNAIHGMSHQKVKADKKWGFIPMTQERIERLIEVVEYNSYKHKTAYLDILYGWKEGDFSQVDKDHNTIWSFQNGTIGKATGILSPAEEKAFIEEYYDIE